MKTLVSFCSNRHTRTLLAALVFSTTYNIGASAEVVTVAGTGKKEYSGDGGLARESGVGEPYGLPVAFH